MLFLSLSSEVILKHAVIDRYLPLGFSSFPPSEQADFAISPPRHGIISYCTCINFFRATVKLYLLKKKVWLLSGSSGINGLM